MGASHCVQQGSNISYSLMNIFLIIRLKRSKPSYQMCVGPKLGTLMNMLDEGIFLKNVSVDGNHGSRYRRKG